MKTKIRLLFSMLSIIFINNLVIPTINLSCLNQEAKAYNKTLFKSPKLIASLPEHNVQLLAANSQNGGVYKGLLLYIDSKSAFFPWINDSNPVFHPRLYLQDINNDNKYELVIILTTGTGSDLHIEEVHIIDPYDFIEIYVENPVDIIKNNVKTSIREENEDVIIQITVNNKTKVIKKEKSYAGFWFKDVGFGSMIHYDINSNLLVAKVGAQVSPSGFVGEVVINYRFLDDKYVLKDIAFKGA